MTKRNLVRVLCLGASVLMSNGSGRAQTDRTIQDISNFVRQSGTILSGHCFSTDSASTTGLLTGLGTAVASPCLSGASASASDPVGAANPGAGLPMPTDGIISDLAVAARRNYISSPPPESSGRMSIRLFVNGAPTPLECALTVQDDLFTSCSNHQAVVCVKAGDRLAVQLTADQRFDRAFSLDASIVKSAQDNAFIRRLLAQYDPSIAQLPNPCA